MAITVNRQRSANMTRKENSEEFLPNFSSNTRYRVDSQIYIFSTSPRKFWSKQTLFPKTELRGCGEGERYVLCTTVPDPVLQASPDLERGGHRTDMFDGWQAAMSLLHPEHPMGASEEWWKAADQGTISDGINLIAYGLFPSRTNPPSEEDLQRAEGLRERYYRRLTDLAYQAAARGAREHADFLRQHEDVYDAMDALGLDADWNRSRAKAKAICPNCGDPILPHLAYHRSSMGNICVLDPERAFRAGAISKEQMEQLRAPIGT
jgi:hypothetical protein